MATAAVTPISVIIPVRDEGERLFRTVRSIVSGRSCRFPLEVVVVDDASSDDACERLPRITQATPEVRLVVRRLPHWSGIPYARNRGAEAASYPIYVTTDANTRFPKNWDLPIRRSFQRHRLLAGTIADASSSFRGHGCALTLPSMGVTWIPVAGAYAGHVPIAACSLTVIDRSLFHHLGGYDESLPLYGAAEPEFSLRAWLSAYEIVNVPDLVIHHRFRPRSERRAFHETNSPVLLRNYLRFACYYLPEELLARTYKYYAKLAPSVCTAWQSELEDGEVWARRAQLKRQLPFDFQWFARKFALPISAEMR
jgi:glycosyltransferase involved in cell wall biosynthesis